jgi:hypothetical protein
MCEVYQDKQDIIPVISFPERQEFQARNKIVYNFL